jgi:hypothetical protein
MDFEGNAIHRDHAAILFAQFADRENHASSV